MKDNMKAATSNSRFHWNTGGWFGGLIGSTAYMLIIGVIVLFESPKDGAPLVLCGVIPNLLGYYLWKRRIQIDAYYALQAATLGVLIFAALFFAFIAWVIDPHIASKYFTGIEKAWWVLLVFPYLMLFYWNIERNGRKRPQPRS